MWRFHLDIQHFEALETFIYLQRGYTIRYYKYLSEPRPQRRVGKRVDFELDFSARGDHRLDTFGSLFYR
jgi:hypothetical protein